MLNLYEECGVAAYYLKNPSVDSIDVPISLINLGSALQHRGQKSCGATFYNPFRQRIISTHKDLGLVSKVFCLDNLKAHKSLVEKYKSIAGIFHTRYCTSGQGNKTDESAKDEVQPFERRHGRLWKRFALAFNGNFSNYRELRKNLEQEHDYHFDTSVDTEVLMHLMALELVASSNHDGIKTSKPDLFKVTENVMKNLDGAYNVVSLFADGKLLVFRDPHGFRPLVWGENKKAYAIASESRALERIGIKNFQDVNPGEAIIFNGNTLEKRIISQGKKSFCHFEGIYFEKANSKNDGIQVKMVRENSGRRLAREEPLKDQFNYSNSIVAPAPWAAIPAAETYAEERGLRLRLAIEKDETLRGFINGADDRIDIMNRIYVVHSGDVYGKKVIIVDDSLVRGETSKLLIQRVRQAGAIEVHLRLTEPPIGFPCFYGIDIPTRKELIVNKFENDLEKNIAQEIGADSVYFQTIEGLVDSFGLPKENLCLACLDKNYPTPFGKKRLEEAMNVSE
jgi:amidophosphoribosyltransferase